MAQLVRNGEIASTLQAATPQLQGLPVVLRGLTGHYRALRRCIIQTFDRGLCRITRYNLKA
jgi:hypothetical protein